MAVVATSSTDASASPSRKTNKNLFDFQTTAPARRPRPWDRAPKSPFANPRGRKVWKRYELRATHSAAEACTEFSDEAQVESSNSARPVKRLRVKPAIVAAGEEQNQKLAASYITTLHEISSGTPKRKYAKRKSLRPDRLRALPTRKSGRFRHPDKVSALSPVEVKVEEALPQFEELSLPAKCDHLRTDESRDETKTGIVQAIHSVSRDEDGMNTFSAESSSSDSDAGVKSLWEATTEIHEAISIEDGATMTSLPIVDIVGVIPAVPIEAHDKDFNVPSPEWASLASPKNESLDSPRAFKATISDKNNSAITPTELNSSAEAACNESQPFVITGCEQLEATSEKSIIAISADPCAVSSALGHSNSPGGSSSVERQLIHIGRICPMENQNQKSSVGQIMGGPEASQQVEPVAQEENPLIDSFEFNLSASRGEAILAGDDTIDESSRRISGLLVETCEPSLYHGLAGNETVEPQSLASTQLVQNEDSVTDDCHPGTNADDADIKETRTKETSEANQEQIEGPRRSTRSATRFSDDTKMLKDFVNRVQARKAAKDIPISVYVAAPIATPRRSPRKALAEVNKNSPSPRKPNDLANRPGTPPGDLKLGTIGSDDLDEIAAEQTTCRRSARTRIFAPSTTAAGAPSFIPVRRADGEAIVLLQKSQAQELATITRTNTKRNKGQSKPPKMTLRTLAADASEESIERPGRAGEGRAVGWDETLVYYQNRSEWEAGKTEKRRTVGRTRNVGATNGTPARTTLVPEADHSHQSSATRGRSKSKCKGKS
ncbi:hypothetical protein MMC07_001807 [Pseudocyphellaria aurata]|nr:hypothetical protein [Pseudocyphellaria aurata]